MLWKKYFSQCKYAFLCCNDGALFAVQLVSNTVKKWENVDFQESYDTFSKNKERFDIIA